MDFDYYELELKKIVSESSYEKDKKFWLKVYNSAEKQGKLAELNELMAEVNFRRQTTIIDNPAAYLTTLIKKDITLEETAITRFEGNLVEHSFYRHGKRTNEPIEYSSSRFDKKTNTEIKSSWITSSSSLVPNDQDADVYKAFQLLFLEQGLPTTGEVIYTKYRICQILKKQPGGAAYKQIENALKYIFDTKITGKEAFLKFGDKIFLNTQTDRSYIRLIDSYTAKDTGDSDAFDQDEVKSKLVLGHEIVENMRLFYSTNIDWDFYVNLKFSLSKRVYEYLEKKRGKEKKGTWKQQLLPFAQKMGMSIKVKRNIKHNIKPALDELVEKSYISEFDIYRDGKTEYIQFVFPGTHMPKQVQMFENSGE